MDKEKVSKIHLVIAIITLIVLALGVWAAWVAYIPNRPALEIYPAEDLGDTPMLSAQCLSDKNVSGGKGEKVVLNIVNTGRMETQHITIKVVSPTFLVSNTENIETIKGGSGGSGVLYIRQKCMQEKCNQSLLPEGIVRITFEFTCRNCELREFTENFDFCIWHESSGICDEYIN
jgi:hypothetical protein